MKIKPDSASWLLFREKVGVGEKPLFKNIPDLAEALKSQEVFKDKSLTSLKSYLYQVLSNSEKGANFRPPSQHLIYAITNVAAGRHQTKDREMKFGSKLQWALTKLSRNDFDELGAGFKKACIEKRHQVYISSEFPKMLDSSTASLFDFIDYEKNGLLYFWMQGLYGDKRHEVHEPIINGLIAGGETKKTFEICLSTMRQVKMFWLHLNDNFEGAWDEVSKRVIVKLIDPECCAVPLILFDPAGIDSCGYVAYDRPFLEKGIFSPSSMQVFNIPLTGASPNLETIKENLYERIIKKAKPISPDIII